jgi:hypothetical protein
MTEDFLLASVGPNREPGIGTGSLWLCVVDSASSGLLVRRARWGALRPGMGTLGDTHLPPAIAVVSPRDKGPAGRSAGMGWSRQFSDWLGGAKKKKKKNPNSNC